MGTEGGTEGGLLSWISGQLLEVSIAHLIRQNSFDQMPVHFKPDTNQLKRRCKYNLATGRAASRSRGSPYDA